MIQHYTCVCVLKSDLFEGLELLLDEFIMNCPWYIHCGASRTLVLADRLLEHFELSIIKHQNQLEEFKKRVASLENGDQTYVDLEN